MMVFTSLIGKDGNDKPSATASRPQKKPGGENTRSHLVYFDPNQLCCDAK
jgi:hypothetical protein